MVAFAFFITRMISPNNPNPEKLTSYECGEEPQGSGWMPFNTRFYVIALIFLLFDVEMIFILPWATVFGNHDMISFDKRWGWLSLIEMFVFLGILILGLVYVWAKGDLNWIKPNVIKPSVDTHIPFSMYEKLNKQQSNYNIKEFIAEGTPEPIITTASENAAQLRKPMFKPMFKKPGNES